MPTETSISLERARVKAMEIDSKELKNFISSAINSVKSALDDQDYGLAGAIEFELGVIKKKKKGAGFSIYVVDASAKYGKEVVSKIKFHAAPKGSKLESAFR